MPNDESKLVGIVTPVDVERALSHGSRFDVTDGARAIGRPLKNLGQENGTES
jgi:hypothetical protein